MRSTQVAEPGPLEGQPPTIDPTAKADKADTISAQKVRDLYDKGTKSIRREQRDYWINRCFVSGEQWISWNSSTQRLENRVPRGASSSRVLLSVNRLRTSSRTNMAKLLRRPLVFEVPPTGADDESDRGSRVAEAVLADRAREHHWEGLREEAAWTIWKGGTGFLCVDWDPRAGTPLGQTQTGKNFGTGDICESVLSIAEVATEPGSRDIERALWWIKAVALPPRDVQEMFNLPKTPAADASSATSPLQFKLLQADGNDSRNELTLVLYYYERPSRKGKGQVAVVIDGKIVDQGPWPFPFKDRLNVVAMRETVVEGRWTGDTILSDAISPQTARNMAESSVVEHMKLAGNARLAIPEGSIEDISTLSDEPGEPFGYVPMGGQRPDYMSPPSMPTWWIEQPERLDRIIDDILGVHDVSRGEVTQGGAKSGVALSLLAEQDDTPLGRFAKEMAEGWGRFASLVLEIYEDKVTETRKARVDNGGPRPELVEWTGKHLAGQTQAEVPLEAVQPRSRAASFQMALQLKQLYPDLPLTVFAAIADLPGQDDLIEGVDPNVEEARRENYEMALGIPIIPALFQNHKTHIAELNRFRMSARFGTLDKQTQDLFEMHAKAHEQLAAEQQVQQMAMQGVQPGMEQTAQANEPAPLGAPPGGPGGPPPGPGGPPGAMPPPGPQGPPPAPSGSQIDAMGAMPDQPAPVAPPGA